MDGSSPQLPSPLLLQSNTASDEARRHWLLEKRLTAPLPDAAVDQDGAPAPVEAAAPAQTGNVVDDEDVDEVKVGEFGIFTHPAKRMRLGGAQGAAVAAPVALGTSGLLEPALAVASRAGGRSEARRTSVGEAHVPFKDRNPAAHADARSAGTSVPGAEAFEPQGVAQAETLILQLKAQIATLQDVLTFTAEQAKASSARCAELEQQADEVRRSNDDSVRQFKTAIIQLAKTCAELERSDRRRRVAQEGARLGSVALQRMGVSLQEVWEDGPAFSDIADRLRALTRAREEVDAARKLLKKRLAPPGMPKDVAAASGEYVGQEEYMLTEEGFKIRIASLRKEEDALTRERERLEREKARYLREVKRIRDEDASRFNKLSVLGGRYVLQFLLGRGGFSEVYKAYDVDERRYVACKVHQLVPQWTEEHKRSYVRHAAREYSIMKRVKHDAIVRLFDVFEIDDDSFCTVLELCDGDDLDVYLKGNGCVPEREARVIIAQIFTGLAYLSSAQRRVIHYDLKPGNVLFDAAGRVKITDFGLSKIMEESSSGTDGLELTSQGAGTYWYLPPECFQTGRTPPKISSKVDVWSAGVIFYQMLYGRRPFGHELTQETILRDETILRNARSVEFPAKPAVSAEAKAFIRKCLTYNQADRPDVQQASADPYLSYLKDAKAKPAGDASGSAL